MRKKWISIVTLLAVLVTSTLFANNNVMASTTGASGFVLELEEDNPQTLVKGETYTLKISPTKTMTSDSIYFVLKYDYDVLRIDSKIVVDKGWSQFIKIEVDEVIVQLSGDDCSLVEGEPFMEIPIVVRQDVAKTELSLYNVNYDGKTYSPLVLGGTSGSTEDDSKDDDSTEESKKAFDLAIANASIAGSGRVPLVIMENTGIQALGITITYDTDIFTFEKIEIGEDFKDKISLQSTYEVPGEGKVGASFLATDTLDVIGCFAYFYVTVNEGVEAGTTSTIYLEVTQASIGDETIDCGRYRSSVITVKEGSQSYALGDVTEDGKVNLIDAMYILKYYNGEKTLTADQLSLADTNSDSKVNLLDALQILRYYNGEISSFS